jgi:Spy/CpxP family protein refolding chaperone
MKFMKSMKSTLIAALALGALLAGGSSLLAQDSTNKPAGERGPGMRGGGRPDFAKTLDLTDEQKPKVDAIMKDSMEKRKALREDTAMSQEDKRAKGKAIQEETTAKMKEVLTPEQFTKYEKMVQGMRGQRPGGPGAGGPPAGGDKPAEQK